MGLSHWVESDNAADFRFTIMEALKQKKGGVAKARQLIRKEMKLIDNRWNTVGFVNVALVMEDAGGKNYDGLTPDLSELMTKKDFQRLITIFNNTLKSVGPDVATDRNTAWQVKAYERMLKFVKGKAK